MYMIVGGLFPWRKEKEECEKGRWKGIRTISVIFKRP